MVSELEKQMATALAGAVNEASRAMCLHDETHMAGAIWTVCDQCGTRWPDGANKPIPEQPKWYAGAVQALAAYDQKAQEQRHEQY